MKIGDRVYVRGYIDEIRKDTVIIRNNGGYFGTIPGEVITGALPPAQPDPNCSEIPNNSDTISRRAAIDVIMDYPHGDVWNVENMDNMVCEIKALPFAQPDLIAQIQNGIKATDADDAYSCGIRNGMRWCISLIDDKEPLYENCPSARPEPCEDAVSRTDVFNAVRGEERGGYVDETVECMLKVMSDLPPVTPKRKTGKWEIYVISPFDGEGCRCSECKYEGAPYWDYCPNCGAKMEEEQ